jgi:hypothetical protein
VLFQIPRLFLKGSPYFDQILAGHHRSSEPLHITDSDVTCSAFANLVYVLHPSYAIISSRHRCVSHTSHRQPDVPRPETLSDWTDVLHLATKWEFQAARATALRAIKPLASSVDLFIIGRTHGVPNWSRAGLVELLARDEDLTLQEARRMPLEEVLLIASGRRKAWGGLLRPPEEVLQVAAKLQAQLPAAAAAVGPQPAVGVAPKPQPPPPPPPPQDYDLPGRWSEPWPASNSELTHVLDVLRPKYTALNRLVHELFRHWSRGSLKPSSASAQASDEPYPLPVGVYVLVKFVQIISAIIVVHTLTSSLSPPPPPKWYKASRPHKSWLESLFDWFLM